MNPPTPSVPAPPAWQPIAILASRLAANCAALAPRYPALAEQLRAFRPEGEIHLHAAGDRLDVARRRPDGAVHPISDRLPPTEAQKVARALFPTGACTEPALAAGIGLGWLWQCLYTAPVHTPTMPGHRPALYFLAREIEELWIACHLHDWQTLLADSRVRLFVGPDAVQQTAAALSTDRLTPWPRTSVTLDPSLWPAGVTFGSMTGDLAPALNAHYQRTTTHLKTLYATHAPTTLPDALAAGRPLRVMGITSRYTTYLQHSMRDWLAGFRALGHDTRLVIEQADHEVLTNLVYAETCAEYRPDLVVMIDHCRGEMTGLPDAVPCVMWIQDHLPHIFSPAAGKAQGPIDYCLGFGRQECVDTFGYPRDRFMPARSAVNDARFAVRTSSNHDFDCDASYVSHASAPADALLADALKRADSADSRALITDIFDRLRAIYDAGGCVTETSQLLDLFRASAASLGLEIGNLNPLTDLFRQRINNALFRHQALNWVADLGVDLRLYGNGWERHPRFAKYARGPADNQNQLADIYRRSRINLQIQPHGAVHQRLCDGLAAGGFFLIRYCPADVVECVYNTIWEWCQQNDIASDDDLQRRATPDIQKLLGELARLKSRDPFSLGVPLVHSMAQSADADYANSAKSIWPEYDSVSFDSASSLKARLTHYLANPTERESLTTAMRQRVVDRLTYTATARRLLDFIATDLRIRFASNVTSAAA